MSEEMKQAAGVSDAALQAIDDAHDWQTTAGRMAAYRAILALRPQAVPMTEADLIDAQSHYIRSRPMFADTKSFADGIRYAEAHHGISRTQEPT